MGQRIYFIKSIEVKNLINNIKGGMLKMEVTVKILNNSSEQFLVPVCKCDYWIVHWDINKYSENNMQDGCCHGGLFKTSWE